MDNAVVSRKGGLSDIKPLATNGVIVMHETSDGIAFAHHTNLVIEKPEVFRFANVRKAKKTKKEKIDDLELLSL